MTVSTTDKILCKRTMLAYNVNVNGRKCVNLKYDAYIYMYTCYVSYEKITNYSRSERELRELEYRKGRGRKKKENKKKKGYRRRC